MRDELVVAELVVAVQWSMKMHWSDSSPIAAMLLISMKRYYMPHNATMTSWDVTRQKYLADV